MALLGFQDIKLTFGGHPLFDGISLHLHEGDRFCLIGRNGTGKSTLMRLIAGEIRADSGDVSRQQGLTVAWVPQDLPDDIRGTVFDVVSSGLGKASGLLAEYHQVSHDLAEPGADTDRLMQKLERLSHDMEQAGVWRIQESVDRINSHLDLDTDADFAALSGGTKRRVLMARALVSEPDILLLDEPTNHLDIETITWLEEFLVKQVTCLLFVTHDRAFARTVANRVAELDRGKLVSYQCGYDEFLTRREADLVAEEKHRIEFDKKLAQEEVWIRRGVKARRTRDEGRVRALKRMRDEWKERRNRVGTARLQIQDSSRSGDLVLETNKLSFSWGDQCIVNDFSTTIMRGDRVGIMGPNGSGKTTLLRLMLGQLEPTSGSVKLGTRLEITYFDQLRAKLDLDRTVIENLGEGYDTIEINGMRKHINAYLEDFLFTPDRVRMPVGILSGGERNRLLLAKLFARPSNLLVMDEPTNDLDAETMDLLAELLANYQGTLLLVSHDRDFLDEVVSSTIVLEGGGKVGEFAGGYRDWLIQKNAALASNNIVASVDKPIVATNVATNSPITTASKKKLSFKETKELEELPAKIAELENGQATLFAEMSDPGFYKKTAAETAQAHERMTKLETELAKAYERWEDLESRV